MGSFTRMTGARTYFTLGYSRMIIKRSLLLSLLSITATCMIVSSAIQIAEAQIQNPTSVNFHVNAPNQRLEIMVNSSRIFTLDTNIPKAQVNNPDLLTLTPLAQNQIQVSATKPGVTQVNLWSEDGSIHTIDVIITGDGRELQMLLESEFPHSSIRVRPLSSSVILSGYVDRPEAVSLIVEMAEDYYPKVINNITVGGVQQVMLKVKVYEISRTKLRNLGINFTAGDFISSDLAIDHNVFIGSVTSNLFVELEALRENKVAKLMSEPNLLTISGRPAVFHSGGEVAYSLPTGNNQPPAVDFKKFGTQVDFVPIVLGNGNIRLEIRPEISSIDESLGFGTVPGFRTRNIDTAVELRSGQTIVLAGLIEERIVTTNGGIPYLADLPYFGVPFRRVHNEIEEVELIIMVTPELVGALDAVEVPLEYPGSSTGILNDKELYWRGYAEVPNCEPNNYQPGTSGGVLIEQYEDVPTGAIVPAGPTVPEATIQIVPTKRDAKLLRRFAPDQTSIRQPVQPDSSNLTAPVPQVPEVTLSAQSLPAELGLIGPIGFDELNF
ncbi:MAG: hypothetical protein COA78_03625 [Blastopirellula sp.]|nr:MAG: hypothetical protein COA78_03625 [Blastopirellula sp.]